MSSPTLTRPRARMARRPSPPSYSPSDPSASSSYSSSYSSTSYNQTPSPPYSLPTCLPECDLPSPAYPYPSSPPCTISSTNWPSSLRASSSSSPPSPSRRSSSSSSSSSSLEEAVEEAERAPASAKLHVAYYARELEKEELAARLRVRGGRRAGDR